MADFRATNGRVFRVQFVHSAHDIKHRLSGEPGGLRQLTDNLALSLRRRVTLCELSEVVTDTNLVGSDGAPVVHVVPLGQGFALCHYHDQFVKATGRAYALGRAAKAAGLDEDTATEIFEFCGF